LIAAKHSLQTTEAALEISDKAMCGEPLRQQRISL